MSAKPVGESSLQCSECTPPTRVTSPLCKVCVQQTYMEHKQHESTNNILKRLLTKCYTWNLFDHVQKIFSINWLAPTHKVAHLEVLMEIAAFHCSQASDTFWTDKTHQHLSPFHSLMLLVLVFCKFTRQEGSSWARRVVGSSICLLQTWSSILLTMYMTAKRDLCMCNWMCNMSL